MMGSKKLSEIKAEIRDAFAKKGITVETWIDQQMEKVQRGPRRDPNVAASLHKVLSALRGALKEKENRGRKGTKSNAKKKPAA
jgi:hypothetical protein